MIFELLGHPNEEDMQYIISDKDRELLTKVNRKEPKSFETLFTNTCPEAIDLI
jgi:predicted transcriptional regulator